MRKNGSWESNRSGEGQQWKEQKQYATCQGGKVQWQNPKDRGEVVIRQKNEWLEKTEHERGSAPQPLAREEGGQAWRKR